MFRDIIQLEKNLKYPKTMKKKNNKRRRTTVQIQCQNEPMMIMKLWEQTD